MSTIIDINVTPTIQEVTINTVDNITVINVNTQSGGGGIESVTGTAVDNTDPDNPVINIPTLQEVLEEQGRMPLEINSNYNFQSSNKYQTIIVDTSNDIDLFMTDNIFNIGDEIEIYNKLSSDVEIRIIDIYASIIYYKNITIDGATLNRAKIPLYSKAWLKCVGTNVFNLVIQSQITIDANPTDGSSNAVSSNGVFDALANKADKSSTQNIVIRNITPSTALTGTTIETQITSFNFTIPANTFSASDILKIETIAWEKSGTANASTCRIKLSNTNNYAGASNVLILAASAGNINMRGTRTYKIAGGNLKGFMSSSANGIFNDNTLTNVAVSTLALDVTQPIYGFVSLTNSSSADSTIVNELIISKW